MDPSEILTSTSRLEANHHIGDDRFDRAHVLEVDATTVLLWPTGDSATYLLDVGAGLLEANDDDDRVTWATWWSHGRRRDHAPVER